MKMKNHLAACLLGAMISTMDKKGRPHHKKELVIRQKTINEIIPNGCSKYYFTPSGRIFTTFPKGYAIEFECIASSEKSAEKKYNKFLIKQKDGKSNT